MSDVQPSVAPETPTPPAAEAPAPPATPEPPSSPATPTGVVPGGEGNSVEGNALTGDAAPREGDVDESAPGSELPSEERLAEMLEESKALSADSDEHEVEEPTVMGTAHVVQDNVSWQDGDDEVPEHERSDARFAGGVTQQDNVSAEGEQRTTQADRRESVHVEQSQGSLDPEA